MFECIRCHKPMFFGWFISSYCNECREKIRLDIINTEAELIILRKKIAQDKIDFAIIMKERAKDKNYKGNPLYCQKHFMTLPCLECSDESGKSFREGSGFENSINEKTNNKIKKQIGLK
jgi:hypothetical protein